MRTCFPFSSNFLILCFLDLFIIDIFNKLALVEDEPSGSTGKRRKVHVHSTVRDWFLYMLDQWMTQRRWGMQQCLCEVQRLGPGMFDGINPNTPYRWKRSAPRAALSRKTLLSPADMTRLSEHILRVTDVLCLSGLTIHGLVLDWLDAEGHDVRPSEWLFQVCP